MMIKTIKRILLSSISILGLSLFIWIVLLLNPSLSYANETQFDNVTVYHNQALEEGTDVVIFNALEIIRNSDIYDKDLNIKFCLNDDKIYPNLYPFAGATAYAFLDKTVMYASIPNFKENYTSFTWEVNDYEERKYNLTALLAHEFMHNLQANFDLNYFVKSTLGKINWKLEGHAEYISREFKNDGLLRPRIARLLEEEAKDHTGVPVFILEDGSIQNLSYFKYSAVIQYLIEVKEMDFKQICELSSDLGKPYSEMLEWFKIESNPGKM